MKDLVFCGCTSIGACNHHCHVTEETIDVLFGPDTILSIKSYLGVPPCYAAKQTILIQSLEEESETIRVRIVGPTRSFDQVEIMKSDISKLKVAPPVRESGDIKESPGFKMIGPKGKVIRDKGLIIAVPHLHLADDESKRLKIEDGDHLCIKTISDYWLEDIIVRVNRFSPVRQMANKLVNEVHIDKDTAIGMNLPIYSAAHIYMDSTDWLERRML